MSSHEDDRRRVLVLIKGLGIGGAERLIAEAATAWDRAAFDYRVAYLLPWKDQLVAPLEHLGVRVDCVGGRRGAWATSVRGLRSLVQSWRPDLIHAHLPATGILARLVSRQPVVYTEHNLADSYRRPTRLLNRATYARNAAVTAVSQAVVDSLATYPGPDPEVIPNGVSCHPEAGAAAAARQELRVGSTTPLIVHVGNIRPHKGHHTLLSATRRIASRCPDALVVSIGGEKHPGDLDRLRAEARSLGLEDAIRFLGRREDARAFLAAADVVTNPADVEGLPVSLLEALALERPVVATAVGGVPGIIEDGVSGRLVPPADPEALAEGILEALSDPAAAEWGKRGAEVVSEHYGIDRMVRAYEDLYRRVLDG